MSTATHTTSRLPRKVTDHTKDTEDELVASTGRWQDTSGVSVYRATLATDNQETPYTKVCACSHD